MPVILDREALEKLLSKLIAKELQTELAELMKLLGDPPNIYNVPQSYWENGGSRLRAAVEPVLQDVYMRQAQVQMAETSIGVDWTLINQSAITWAQQYSFELVRGITARSQAVLQSAIGSYFSNPTTIGKLEQMLEGAFGPVRSEMIAVTEITRAAAEGEQRVVDQLIADNPGMESVDIWLTNKDERVCLICSPRQGKERGDGWTELPPAHPRCRCMLRHDFRRRSEEITKDKYKDYSPELVPSMSRNKEEIMPNENDLTAIKTRIKNMPEDIKLLEPIDPKHRTVRKLNGEYVVLSDELNIGLVKDEGFLSNGSAWSDGKGIYIQRQFIGTQVQDHEYIHSLLFRNRTLRDAINDGKYNPTSFFMHANQGSPDYNEQFTMVMSMFDKDRSIWAKNITTSYSYEGIDLNKATEQVNIIDTFLRSIGLW